MSSNTFSFGDELRHPTRPEWGVGSVTKVENVTVDGRPAQRVSIRFPGQGVKTLNTAYVELERAGGDTVTDSLEAPLHDDAPAAGLFRAFGEDDWLADVNSRRIEEAMRALPESATDPFSSIRRRLERTLELFRFDASGHGLIDWAIAQTGLDDPLTRFNRHELEQFFVRWAGERDAHLSRLFHESDLAPSERESLLSAAPRSARDAARRGGRR